MAKRLKGDSISRGLFWGCTGVMCIGAFAIVAITIALDKSLSTEETSPIPSQLTETAAEEPEALAVRRQKRRAPKGPRIHEGMSLDDVQAALGSEGARKRAIGSGDKRLEVYEWTMPRGTKVEAEFTGNLLKSYEFIQAPPIRVAATVPTNPGVNFLSFTTAITELNNNVKSATGYEFISGAKDLGDGIVEVTMTDFWWNQSTPDERESNLKTIFNLWDTAEGTGHPISVYLVDISGQLSISKNRMR